MAYTAAMLDPGVPMALQILHVTVDVLLSIIVFERKHTFTLDFQKCEPAEKKQNFVLQNKDQSRRKNPEALVLFSGKVEYQLWVRSNFKVGTSLLVSM